MIGIISNCRRGRGWFCWPLTAVLLTACSREEVQTYRIAKENESASPAAAPAMAPADASAPPRVAWKTPAGWEEIPPGEMRAASFSVKGQDGKKADVSIIPLPGLAGGDLDNVNRWRGQVGLPPVAAEGLAKIAETVQIGAGSAQLFDMAGQLPAAKEQSRILAAILRREGVAWFFKMTGDDALVASQKPTFVEFLKSISFQTASDQTALPPSHPPIDGSGPAAVAGQPALPASHPPIGGISPAAAPPDAGDKPNWTVPKGWQETAPGPMQLAKFLASADTGTKAEISVAVIPGDGGGALANANRWRGQIGLGPITAADLPKQTSELEAGGGKAFVLDVTSADKKKRLIAASVPRGSSTWFYKLTGDEAAVGRQKEALVQFIQSAK